MLPGQEAAILMTEMPYQPEVAAMPFRGLVVEGVEILPELKTNITIVHELVQLLLNPAALIVVRLLLVEAVDRSQVARQQGVAEVITTPVHAVLALHEATAEETTEPTPEVAEVTTAEVMVAPEVAEATAEAVDLAVVAVVTAEVAAPEVAEAIAGEALQGAVVVEAADLVAEAVNKPFS